MIIHHVKPCDGDIDRTRRITSWLVGHPLVKGFFTGHYHVSMTQTLEGGKTCWVTAGLFKGEGTLIEID